MKLTLASIFDQMDLHGVYVWTLKGRDQTRTSIPLGQYFGPVNSNSKSLAYEKPEPKISKDLLKKTCDVYPHLTFEIELRNHYKSNSGHIGPVEFTLDNVPVPDPAPPQNTNPFGWPGSIDGIGAFIPRSVLDDHKQVENDWRNLERERTQLMVERVQLKAEKDRHEERVKEWNDERKTLEKNYTDHSNMVSAGVLKGLSKLGGFALPNENGVPLAGVSQQAEPEEPETPEEEFIGELASHIHENITDMPTLKWLDGQVRSTIATILERRKSANNEGHEKEMDKEKAGETEDQP